MLQEIFNSPNCIKIHLYKRADKYNNKLKVSEQILVEKEFTRLTMAASRIIDDEMARIKIVNYKDANFSPSINQ